MTVCSFFLQGRCRYGEKCWNEHPRGGSRGGAGGGGGGYNNNNNYNRSSGQQHSRGGGGAGAGSGGFGNRVWVNPSQQKGGYIQPSSFSSHGGDDWGRGGGGGGGGGNDWGRGGGSGGRRDNVKAAEFSFSSQNRFSALGTANSFNRGGRGDRLQAAAGDEDDDRKLEVIQMDVDIWESSGQWVFSCYSNLKTCLSGFTDLSPEELRLEYYSTRASGDLQGYINGVNQLLHQWRNRVQELKIMNPSTRSAVLAELNNPATLQTSSSSGFDSTKPTGFGSSTSDFGGKGFGAPAPVQPSGFSFAAPSGGFGSSAAPVFGFASAAPAQPPSGLGSSSGASAALSASSFSFSAPTSNPPAAASGFGSASGFSFSATANTGGGLGGSFGAEAPVAAGGSVFGQTSGGFDATPAAGGKPASGASDSLFSAQDKLTPEELNQFKARRFTLGQIPLKPPPGDILVV